jgi:virulence-associated protein VapD
MNTAAALLEVIQLIEAAENAAPIIEKLKEMVTQGATFEQVVEAVRNMAVANESDAQAAIDKAV